MNTSCLYVGAVTHARMRPKRHRLRYAMFNLLLDFDELPLLARRLRLFSHERFNLFSFFEADHGDGAPGGLRNWVERHARGAGLEPDGGAIKILCMPRILGHAFNPISVYFCHRRDGTLLAMLYEVNNTFGERHTYLMPAHGQPGAIRQRCDKRLYVSPFMPMRLTYRFRVTPPGERISVAIDAADSEGVLIATAFAGTCAALSDRVLLKMFSRMPFLGAKVLFAIHWEALKIWCKGVRLVRRPPAPATSVSYSA